MLIKDIEKQSATISWNPPLDDGGLEITKYLIEKYEIASMTWTKVADVEKTVTSYTVQELQTNAEYMFRVYAQNPIGKSEPLESKTVSIKSTLSKKNIINIKETKLLTIVTICRSTISTSSSSRCFWHDCHIVYYQMASIIFRWWQSNNRIYSRNEGI